MHAKAFLLIFLATIVILRRVKALSCYCTVLNGPINCYKKTCEISQQNCQSNQFPVCAKIKKAFDPFIVNDRICTCQWVENGKIAPPEGAEGSDQYLIWCTSNKCNQPKVDITAITTTIAPVKAKSLTCYCTVSTGLGTCSPDNICVIQQKTCQILYKSSQIFPVCATFNTKIDSFNINDRVCGCQAGVVPQDGVQASNEQWRWCTSDKCNDPNSYNIPTTIAPLGAKKLTCYCTHSYGASLCNKNTCEIDRTNCDIHAAVCGTFNKDFGEIKIGDSVCGCQAGISQQPGVEGSSEIWRYCTLEKCNSPNLDITTTAIVPRRTKSLSCTCNQAYGEIECIADVCVIGQVSCDYMFGKAKTFPVCSIFNKDVGSYKAGTRNCLCQEVENNNIPQEGAQKCYDDWCWCTLNKCNEPPEIVITTRIRPTATTAISKIPTAATQFRLITSTSRRKSRTTKAPKTTEVAELIYDIKNKATNGPRVKTTTTATEPEDLTEDSATSAAETVTSTIAITAMTISALIFALQNFNHLSSQ